jgi:Polyphosphate kinase 2 (PPK2)
MKTADFIVDKRPRLAAIEGFPKVDLSDYERRLSELQETLQRVQQAYLGTPHRAVIVLEGWDPAGKGGVVRRLGWALDPRSFKVAATAAPGGREKSLHYLQRFWERLPEHGQIVAFDRSWYGRVPEHGWRATCPVPTVETVGHAFFRRGTLPGFFLDHPLWSHTSAISAMSPHRRRMAAICAHSRRPPPGPPTTGPGSRAPRGCDALSRLFDGESARRKRL